MLIGKIIKGKPCVRLRDDDCYFELELIATSYLLRTMQGDALILTTK